MGFESHERTKIFISYSHRDREWLDRLLVHLKPLEREGLVESWADTRIAPGQKWRTEIEEAIDSASVAILLVSADFLASDFIVEKELPPLLEAANNRGATILSIVVGPCGYQQNENLSQFQAINSPSKTLIQMTKGEQEAVFRSVSNQIFEIRQAPFLEFRERVREKFKEIERQCRGKIQLISQEQALSATEKGFLSGMWEVTEIDQKLAALKEEQKHANDEKVRDFLAEEFRRLEHNRESARRRFKAHFKADMDATKKRMGW